MNAASGAAVSFLITLAILIGLLLLFRRLVLWYWRLNEAVERLKSIDESLALIAGTKVGELAELLTSIDASLQQLPAVRQWKIQQGASRGRVA